MKDKALFLVKNNKVEQRHAAGSSIAGGLTIDVLQPALAASEGGAAQKQQQLACKELVRVAALSFGKETVGKGVFLRPLGGAKRAVPEVWTPHMDSLLAALLVLTSWCSRLCT